MLQARERPPLTEPVFSTDIKLSAVRDQVTVVIPTLNEEEAIGPLIEEVRSQGLDKILVADGYSTDKTTAIASGLGVEVVMQYGKGKAGALLTAFQRVRTPYLVVMDGDGSYDPADIVKMIPMAKDFDFVKGIRERNQSMSKIHKLGNSVITRTFDILFGTSIGDVCSGMYLLKSDKARDLHPERHPMAVEQEIAAEMVFASGSITTIPIRYRKRAGGESKVNTWRQGIRDLWTNFDLARTFNPILLFSALATLALFPAFIILTYAVYLQISFNQYHSGFFLAGLVLVVLGAQGFTVGTIAGMLRRIDRRISQLIA